MAPDLDEGISFKDGDKILAWGRIKVYEKAGRYQLYVERMKPSGLGALAAAFEALKKRLSAEVEATFYVPLSQYTPRRRLTLVARTPGDPAQLLPALREAIWSVDPQAPINASTTLEELMLEMMFMLPSQSGVKEVVITRDVVSKKSNQLAVMEKAG